MRFALVAIAAIALHASAATAISEGPPKSTHHQAPPPRTCTAEAMTGFAAKVWRLPAWERGAPGKAAWRAYHRRLACAPSAAHRRVMLERWQDARAEFNAHRRHQLREARYLDAITPPGAAVLATIRYCESGGDYSVIDSSGTYSGAYQFDAQAWADVGGTGIAAEAPPREQDERAAQLYRERGAAPWPVCGV